MPEYFNAKIKFAGLIAPVSSLHNTKIKFGGQGSYIFDKRKHHPIWIKITEKLNN